MSNYIWNHLILFDQSNSFLSFSNVCWQIIYLIFTTVKWKVFSCSFLVCLFYSIYRASLRTHWRVPSFIKMLSLNGKTICCGACCEINHSVWNANQPGWRIFLKSGEIILEWVESRFTPLLQCIWNRWKFEVISFNLICSKKSMQQEAINVMFCFQGSVPWWKNLIYLH